MNHPHRYIPSSNILLLCTLLLLLFGAVGANDVEYRCPNEFNAAFECFVGEVFSLSEADACITCWADAINAIPQVSTCSPLEAHFCANLENCETLCGSCLDELVDVFECAIQGCYYIECPGLGGDFGTGTGASNCPAEFNAVQSCFGSLSAARTCADCYVHAIPQDRPPSSTTTNCQDFENQFCFSFESCQDVCGNCVDEVIEFTDCAMDSFVDVLPDCDVHCSGNTAAASNCPLEYNAVQSCFDSLSSAQACAACAGDAMPEYPVPSSCQDFENQFCDSFESCQDVCGSCVDEVMEFTDCAVDLVSYLPDCDVDCGGDNSNTAASNCPSEYNAVLSCFDSLSTAQACADCYSDAIQEDAPSSCQDFENQFCGSFESCQSICGNCFAEVIEYTDCWIDFVSFLPDCDIDCPTAGDDCASEANTVNTCLSSLPLQQECVSCYNNAAQITGASSCVDIEVQFCSALNQTNCQNSCGRCIDEMVSYFDCMVALVPSLPDCQIDCRGEGNPDPPAPNNGGSGASTSVLASPEAALLPVAWMTVLLALSSLLIW